MHRTRATQSAATLGRFPRPRCTPVLAFRQRHLGADLRARREGGPRRRCQRPRAVLDRPRRTQGAAPRPAAPVHDGDRGLPAPETSTRRLPCGLRPTPTGGARHLARSLQSRHRTTQKLGGRSRTSRPREPAMGRMMRSARLAAPRRWELLEQEIPEPGDGTMLVHLRRTAICGTDKPSWVGLAEEYPLPRGPAATRPWARWRRVRRAAMPRASRCCSTASTGPSTRSTAWPPTTAAASACPPMPSPRWCS